MVITRYNYALFGIITLFFSLENFRFSSIAQNRTWGIMIVDEKTQLACAKMRAEQLCHSYSYISSQLKIATANENEVGFLKMHFYLKKTLI